MTSRSKPSASPCHLGLVPMKRSQSAGPGVPPRDRHDSGAGKLLKSAYALFRRGVNPLRSALILATLLTVGTSWVAAGQDRSLPKPTQQVILSVTGDIERRNSESGAQFDRPMLEALGVESVRTSTAWTEGTVEFVGVPAKRVMEAVGARGEAVIAAALDHYQSEIPISDFDRYPVLLALRMDGQELPKDRGPIWIVYPRDSFPELQNEAANSRWVWQLRELRVK